MLKKHKQKSNEKAAYIFNKLWPIQQQLEELMREIEEITKPCGSFSREDNILRIQCSLVKIGRKEAQDLKIFPYFISYLQWKNRITIIRKSGHLKKLYDEAMKRLKQNDYTFHDYKYLPENDFIKKYVDKNEVPKKKPLPHFSASDEDSELVKSAVYILEYNADPKSVIKNITRNVKTDGMTKNTLLGKSNLEIKNRLIERLVKNQNDVKGEDSLTMTIKVLAVWARSSEK